MAKQALALIEKEKVLVPKTVKYKQGKSIQSKLY